MKAVSQLAVKKRATSGVKSKPAKRSDHQLTERPTVLLVLGMHRSGTSVTARLLECLGAVNSTELMPPVSGNNDKGFFEDYDIYKFNEFKFLPKLGVSWHSLGFVDWSNLSTPTRSKFALEALEILRKNYSLANPLSILKEPRMGILLPFWLSVLRHAGFQPKIVCTVRDPASVARSLGKRNGFSISQSGMLYVTNWISILSGIQDLPVAFVQFDEVFSNPAKVLRQVADKLCIPVPADFDSRLHSFSSSFFDASLRHSTLERRDLPLEADLPPLAIELYENLLAAAQSQNIKKTAKFLQSAEEAVSKIKPVLTDFDLSYACLSGEKQKNAAIQCQLDHAISELERTRRAPAEAVLLIEKEAQQRGQLAERLTALDAEKQGVCDELESARQQKAQLESQAATLAQERDALAADKATLDSRLSTLSSEHSALVTSHASLVAERDDLATERNFLTTERGQLAERITTLEGTKQQLASELEALRQQHQAAEQQIATLTTERDNLSAKRSTLDARLSTLIAERDDLATRHQSLATERNSLATERGQLAERLTALDAEKQGVCDELESARQQKAQLESQAATLAQERDALSAERSTLDSRLRTLDSEHSALVTIHATLVEERDDLATERNFLTTERGQLAERITTLEGTKQQLASELEALRQQHQAAEQQIATLTTERDNLSAKRSTLDARLSALVAERDDLATRHQSLATERDALSAQRDDLAQSVDDRFRELAQLTKQFLATEDALAAEKTQSSELKATLAEMRGRFAARVTALEETKLQQTSDIEALTNKRDGLASERGQLAERLTALSDERSTLDARLSTLSSEHASLVTSHSSLVAERDELATEYEALASSLSQRFEEIALLGKRVLELEAESDRRVAAIQARMDAMAARFTWKLGAPARFVWDKTHNTAVKISRLPIALQILFKHRQSGIFDHDWYFKQNPDIKASTARPFLHFAFHGVFEGRAPNPSYNESAYLRNTPSAQSNRMKPLLHYTLQGWKS